MSDTPSSVSDLLQAIVAVAACPCEDHQTGFLDSLAQIDEVIFKQVVAVSEPEATTPSGVESRVQLEMVEVQGNTFLLALPDLASARLHDPSATFVGIPRAEAFGMVLADQANAGIVFISGTRQDAWAIASRASLAEFAS